MIASSNMCFYTDNDDENIKTSCKGAQKKKVIKIITDILMHGRHPPKIDEAFDNGMEKQILYYNHEASFTSQHHQKVL